MIENPWIDLPDEPPYVLPGDAHWVDAHNLRASGRPNPDRERLHTELLPDPYAGNPLAQVVVLLKHSGYSEEDEAAHEAPALRTATLANLIHEPSDWPLYPLNPEFEEMPAGRWWRSFTKHLVKRVGLRAVATRLFCLQLSPYHSVGGTVHVPSRLYSRDLLRSAMRRNALVVGLLAQTEWNDFVPELRTHRHCIWPKGQPQQALLTPGNLGREEFERIARMVEI